MRGVFDDEGLEPAKSGNDTELTLSSAVLLGMFCGLVLLCGLCFGFGYVVGHRSSRLPSASNLPPTVGAETAAQADGSRPKPPASPVTVTPPTSSTAVNQPPVSMNSAASAVPTPQISEASPSASSSVQPLVRPALPTPANTAPFLQPGTVAPAMEPTPAGTLMVQIAAITNLEDANVLMNALRKRGYAVTVRREVTDGMIHVRIGPFSSRDEANKWRLKLLNDGYNAIVQP